MLESIQARRVEASHLKAHENAISLAGSDGLAPAPMEQAGCLQPRACCVCPVIPTGRGALTSQILMQKKGTFEAFIWGTKASLYLDSGAAFKALVQTELCLSNSSALSLYMPEILILS